MDPYVKKIYAQLCSVMLSFWHFLGKEKIVKLNDWFNKFILFKTIFIHLIYSYPVPLISPHNVNA